MCAVPKHIKPNMSQCRNSNETIEIYLVIIRVSRVLGFSIIIMWSRNTNGGGTWFYNRKKFSDGEEIQYVVKNIKLSVQNLSTLIN